MAGLLVERPDLVLVDELRMAVGEVLRSAAVELDNGRALPIPVRRAVRRMADQLRIQLEPEGGADS